jgi:hypothetical protein
MGGSAFLELWLYCFKVRIEIIMGHDGRRSYYQIERNELIMGSSL